MDLKLKAHIGDSLADLFARTLMTDLVETGLLSKQVYFVHAGRVTSNEHFSKTAKEYKLFHTEYKLKYYDERTLGTMYEAHLYDIYKSDGFDAAFSFFKETAYKLYLETSKIFAKPILLNQQH